MLGPVHERRQFARVSRVPDVPLMDAAREAAHHQPAAVRAERGLGKARLTGVEAGREAGRPARGDPPAPDRAGFVHHEDVPAIAAEG